MTYQQLTQEERYQMQALLALGSTQIEIASMLRRDPSTISRERRRNARADAEGAYQAKWAHAATRKRRVDKGERCRKIQGALQVDIEAQLRLSWSPEQISGRLRLERGIRICHETIYQHVLRDSRRRGVLRYCLRFGGYKHFRFKKSTVGAKTRLRKHSIHDRCDAANNRSELGHWERDCVLGQRGASALLTIVDRKSRYTRIRHVKKVDTAHVALATEQALAAHRSITKTITNDNGVEFQRDEALQLRLRVPIYFTDPSSPWQRGSIENLNGLVRQYVRKRTDIDTLPAWLPRALEQTLNHRPRKTLGFKTPHEVFYQVSVLLIANQRMHFGLKFSSHC